jgi:hypothetical protein
MWRPEGFNTRNIAHDAIRHYHLLNKGLLPPETWYVEAGADAMIEALKKDGTHFRVGEWTDDATFETDKPGYVVFIPDEVEK